MTQGVHTASETRAREAARSDDEAVGFGELVSEMLSVALVLLSFTTVVTWMVWSTR